MPIRSSPSAVDPEGIAGRSADQFAVGDLDSPRVALVRAGLDDEEIAVDRGHGGSLQGGGRPGHDAIQRLQAEDGALAQARVQVPALPGAVDAEDVDRQGAVRPLVVAVFESRGERLERAGDAGACIAGLSTQTRRRCRSKHHGRKEAPSHAAVYPSRSHVSHPSIVTHILHVARQRVEGRLAHPGSGSTVTPNGKSTFFAAKKSGPTERIWSRFSSATSRLPDQTMPLPSQWTCSVSVKLFSCG